MQNFDPFTGAPVVISQGEGLPLPNDTFMDTKVRPEGVDLNEMIRGLQVKLITQAMRMSGGNTAMASRLLNLNRTTLVMKMKKLGMKE